MWLAPGIDGGIIGNIRNEVNESYYGSGGGNVGTFKLFVSKDVYPDGWYSFMPQSFKEIDTDEVRNNSNSSFQLYLYDGDVYEAFKKGESAAELWCPVISLSIP